MIKIAITVYVVIALCFASWSDAMDKRFGVWNGKQSSWLTQAIVGSVWPLALPMSLTALACCESRWNIKPAAITTSQRGTE